MTRRKKRTWKPGNKLFTRAQREEIRECVRIGNTLEEVARAYNCSPSTVGYIVKGIGESYYTIQEVAPTEEETLKLVEEARQALAVKGPLPPDLAQASAADLLAQVDALRARASLLETAASVSAEDRAWLVEILGGRQ